METVRVSVIGTGFGKYHIRAFGAHPRAVVTAVCSTDAGRAAKVAAEFGVPNAYGDYRQMLDEAPIDAVAVITHPADHVPISFAALAAGKHVLCAKPLATTLEDARALLRRAQESGLVHAIDQQVRFTAQSLRAKELLEAGAIGRPLSLVNTFLLYLPSYFANPHASPNKNTWFASRERSGGLFLANAPHEFDRLLWFFGPVRTLYGRAHTAVPEVVASDGRSYHCDALDSYHAVLEFQNGLMGLTQCTPVSWPTVARRLEIHGDTGSLLLEEVGPGQALRLATPADRGYVDQKLPDGLPSPHAILIDRFVRAVLDGEPMSPSFEDGCRTQELIEAVVRGSKTGERQVLPLP